MVAITKADITNYVSDILSSNKLEARKIVETMFEEVALALSQGTEVRISGLGSFKLRDKKLRPGRNPKTGKEFEITPRRVVVFRVGQKLKDRIEKYAGEQATPPSETKN
jgi:integration host factor subunit alpha